MIKAIAAGLAVLVLGALSSTGYLAWYCGYFAFWPFKTHEWLLHCMAGNPNRQMHALLIFLAFALVAGLVANFCRRGRKEAQEFGASKWATMADVRAAGLVMKPSERSKLIHVLGKFAGHFLTYVGDAHVLICGGNRSGKGRGPGVSTLLSLASSVVVHDSKGELYFGNPKHRFVGTAGFRRTLGHKVIYFNPKDRRSARYNPLLMVRKGDHEISDMQRLIITLFGHAPKDFWEKGGGRMLLAIGLHVLYGEPDGEKSLAGMARFLDRGDEGLERIMNAKAHPLAARIAKGFFPGGVGSKDDSKVKGMRSGLYFTARDFLAFYDDPIAETVTSGLCHFEPADMVRHEKPTALYLVPPPDDQERAAPLLNLIIGQILGDLVSELDHTATGYPKNHHTVLFLDEMAGLGRMNDLVRLLPQMPGYGVMAMMFIQSISQIEEIYSPNIASTIIDNCGVSVWFAAADDKTAARVSRMIGNASEVEQTVTRSRPMGALIGGVETIGEREIYRPVMDAGAVRELHRDKEIVLVNGAKPIKASKIQYDKEAIFKPRLLPPPPIGDDSGNYPGLTPIPSPWCGLAVQQVSVPVSAPVSVPAETIDDVPDFQPEW